MRKEICGRPDLSLTMQGHAQAVRVCYRAVVGLHRPKLPTTSSRSTALERADEGGDARIDVHVA
jgi:hypothetical protein